MNTRLQRFISYAVMFWLWPLWQPVAQAEEDNDTLFIAVSAVAGLRDNIHIDENLQRDTSMEDFWSINLELRAQYAGLFAELPGNSQETEDGQYAGPAVGYNFYESRHWLWDVIVIQTAGETENTFASPDRIYIDRRSADWRAGLRATGYFDRLMTQVLVTPYSLKSAIGGFEASASARYDWQVRNLNLFVSGGVRYRSGDIWTHYFGISADNARNIEEIIGDYESAEMLRDFFAPYDLGGAFSISARAGFEYPLTQHVVVGGFVNVEQFPSAVVDGPFRAGDNHNVVTGLSLTYVF